MERIAEDVNQLVVKRNAELCVNHIDLLFKSLMDVLSGNELICEEILR